MEQLKTVETQIGEMQWWVNKHDNNITDLNKEVDAANTLIQMANSQESSFGAITTAANTLVTMSAIPVNAKVTKSSKSKKNRHYGCGAISDAWEPSQSSVKSSVWKRRLRPRTAR